MTESITDIIKEIECNKGIVDLVTFFNFCYDYACAVGEELNIPHDIKKKLNPYIVKESYVMANRIRDAVIDNYEMYDNIIDINNILGKTNPVYIAHREFMQGKLRKTLF